MKFAVTYPNALELRRWQQTMVPEAACNHVNSITSPLARANATTIPSAWPLRAAQAISLAMQ